MLSSTTLEVAIGMALVYLLLSLFCTAINEAIAGILGSRAKNLEKGIKSLFTEGMSKDGKTSLCDAIYAHGLIQSLYKSGTGAVEAVKNYPSYIPSRTFASALLAVLFTDKAKPAALPTDLQTMIDKVNSLPEGKGKDAIMTLVIQAEGDIARTRDAFEKWYDDGMDRAAGWYKRKTQLVLFFLGLTIAIVLNVDSIAVGRTLWVTPALRSYTISAADDYAKEHPIKPRGSAAGATAPADAKATLDAASADLAALQSLSLPIGWGKNAASWWYAANCSAKLLGFLPALAGWLLTAMAMTLGAPFWFDALNKFMVVRSTIKPREKSGVEASKDSLVEPQQQSPATAPKTP